MYRIHGIIKPKKKPTRLAVVQKYFCISKSNKITSLGEIFRLPV